MDRLETDNIWWLEFQKDISSTSLLHPNTRCTIVYASLLEQSRVYLQEAGPVATAERTRVL